MPTVDLSEVKLRDLNAALHKLPKDTNETHWVITNPSGKHAIACGVDLPTQRFEEHNGACFIIRDHNEQALAYVYYEDETP
jgi:methylamine---glutamate N-methyltransferase subunit B